jgi:hypothetical protein
MECQSSTFKLTCFQNWRRSYMKILKAPRSS